MKKIYKSSVSKRSYVMLLLMKALLIAPFLSIEELSIKDLKNTGFLIYIIITFLIVILLFWIYFGTYYKIENNYLYHHSGPFFGKMKISSIQKITYHSGCYVPVTYKPSTDTIGLIITYNKFDDIYFSPKDRDLLVNDLLGINSEIQVVKN